MIPFKKLKVEKLTIKYNIYLISNNQENINGK